MEVKQQQEEDRISLLPDYLIIHEILSRLPSTKHAIRTGTLSKRWQYLWPSLPTLIFKDYDTKMYTNLSGNKHLSDFYLSVDKTLTQCRHRQLKNLNKFELWTNYDNRFKSHVNNWICFAINCNVQLLHLHLRYEEDERFVLEDDTFFVHSYFTHLDIGKCEFKPTSPISWNNLTDLTISYARLDEGLIANILSGCPLLETLEISDCHGYSFLDITSKSVKKLIFYGYHNPESKNKDDIVEINAPYISSLTIDGCLLRDVSSLDKAYLNYIQMGYCEMTYKEEEEEMLKRFILHLYHVKELQIGNHCNKAFSRLKAKGCTN